MVADYLIVKISNIPNAGRGLFTTKGIKRWYKVCQFLGEIIAPEEHEKRGLFEDERSSYMIDLGNGLFMDSFPVECLAKYANDAIDSKYKNNCGIRVESKLNRAFIVSLKYIKPGEEILVDYGVSYWENYKQWK